MNCECSHKKIRKASQDFPIKRKLESRVVFLGPLSTSIKQISKFLFEGMFFLWALFLLVCGHICVWVHMYVCLYACGHLI